jgi:hypothetical protein
MKKMVVIIFIALCSCVPAFEPIQEETIEQELDYYQTWEYQISSYY